MPIGAPAQISSEPKKRATPRKSSAVSSQPAVTQTEARYEGLLGVGQIGQAVCIMRGLFADAGAITLHWPNVSRETAALAAQNEQIGKAIDYLISAGPYSALLLAALPLGLQIAANHGRIDVQQAAGIAGVMDPETLAAKVRGDLDKQKLEVIRQAEQARQDAQRLAETVASAQATQNGAGSDA